MRPNPDRASTFLGTFGSCCSVILLVRLLVIRTCIDMTSQNEVSLKMIFLNTRAQQVFRESLLSGNAIQAMCAWNQSCLLTLETDSTRRANPSILWCSTVLDTIGSAIVHWVDSFSNDHNFWTDRECWQYFIRVISKLITQFVYATGFERIQFRSPRENLTARILDILQILNPCSGL